jgi:hypothetical protein
VFYRWDNDSLILNIRVQPRASRTELAEIIGDEIKLRLTSAPVDGKANAQLIAYLAKTFGVAKSGISIISGEKGKNKRVRIQQPAKLPQGLIAIKHGYNSDE